MIPYQLTLDERPGYLHAKVVGERTPENAMRCLDEVSAACVRAGNANVRLFEDAAQAAAWLATAPKR